MNEREIFIAARHLRDAAERDGFLNKACAGDQELRRRIVALLDEQDQLGSFLEHGEQPAGATINLPASENPGTVIGPYKLIEPIGEGGMGTVWMAQQTEPVKRLVALKLIKAGMDSKQVIARFEAERQALALMDHANIARVLDGGTTGAGRPYFVMDLVKGVPITRYCDDHHLTPRERLELFLPVCQAVQHAHQKGIIHRDLKPSNVLVALYDGKPVPKVIDFGVAKAAGQPLTEKTLVTGFGNIVGTLEYMSPEQAEINQLDIDTRSDIYSLGVLLYELLTGSTPFTKKDLEKAGMLEMLRVIREDEPSKPSMKLSTAEGLPTLAANRGTEPAKLTKLVRGELDWIVMKALEKDRNRRYETANGFAMDVQRYLADEAVLACPPSAGYRLKKFARRNKGGLAVAALVLFFLVVLGIGVGWVVRDRAAERAERQAEVERERMARQGRVTAQAETFLADVERLEKEEKWDDALAAAKRAEAALAAGEADPGVQEKVRQAVKGLEMVRRLERIRTEQESSRDGQFNRTATIEAYARAFREFGVDVESLPTDEAITRLSTHRGIALPLAAALDHWAQSRVAVFRRDPSWRSLMALARRLDSDPLRNKLRVFWDRKPTPEVQAELRTLVESIDVRRHAPATLISLYVRLGTTALGELQERVLRQAQQAHPGDIWVNMALGNFLWKRKNHEEAIRFYSAAVAARPTNAATHTNLGNALAGKGRPDEAIACYREAIRLQADFAVAHHALGNVLENQRKLDEAIAAYKEAVRVKPDFAEAHDTLGIALVRRGKLEDAIAAFREAVRLMPDVAEAHQHLGQALSIKGQTDEAIAEYRKAIRLKPAISYAYVSLGALLCDVKRDYDGAVAAFREATKLWPKLAMAHHNLGIALRHQGKLEEAIASLRAAVRLDPKCTSAHYELAHALSQERKPDDAIVSLRKVIELDPKNAGAHNDLGCILCDVKRDYDGAIPCFRKVIELDPKDALGHTNLGHALMRNGRVNEAIACYRQAIALDPKCASSHDRLAWLLATCRETTLRDPAGAVKHAKQAVELNRSNGMYWQTLAWAQYRAGDWKAAISSMERVTELGSPGDSFEWFLLAMARWKLGDKNEARKWYDKAVAWMDKNQPKDEELRRFRAEAEELMGVAGVVEPAPSPRPKD